MKKYGMLAAACGLLAAAAPAAAQDSVLRTDNARLNFAVGYYDVLDDEGAVDLRVDYQSGYELPLKLQPWVGLEVTTDGSVWGGGGLLADLYITPNIVFTPSAGVGLYSQGGGVDLGGPIQFRTGVGLAYELNERGDRLGLNFSHLSNAGIYSDNPGTEIVGLTYSIRF